MVQELQNTMSNLQRMQDLNQISEVDWDNVDQPDWSVEDLVRATGNDEKRGVPRLSLQGFVVQQTASFVSPLLHGYKACKTRLAEAWRAGTPASLPHQ